MFPSHDTLSIGLVGTDDCQAHDETMFSKGLGKHGFVHRGYTQRRCVAQRTRVVARRGLGNLRPKPYAKC